MEALLFDWPISSPSSWVNSSETTSDGDWNLNFFFVGSELFLGVASWFWWIMINCCDWSCCEYVIHPSRVLVYKTTRIEVSARRRSRRSTKSKAGENESRKNLTIPVAHTHDNWKVRIGSASSDATSSASSQKHHSESRPRLISHAHIHPIVHTANSCRDDRLHIIYGSTLGVTFRVTTNNERASRSAK